MTTFMKQGYIPGFPGAESFSDNKEPFFGYYNEDLFIVDAKGFTLITVSEDNVLEQYTVKTEISNEIAEIMAQSIDCMPEEWINVLKEKGELLELGICLEPN